MNEHAHRGAVAEAKAMAKLTELGHVCSVPTVHNARYDLVVDVRGTAHRVQVKHGYFDKNGKFRVDLRGRNSYKGKEPYEAHEIDAFVVYNGMADECYWFWIDETPATGMKRDVDTYYEHDIRKKL